MEAPKAIFCPECGSGKFAKTGLRLLSMGKETQTFKCSECGRKFSENYIRCPRQLSTAHYALNGEREKMDSVTESKTVTGNLENIEIKIAKHHGKMMHRTTNPQRSA